MCEPRWLQHFHQWQQSALCWADGGQLRKWRDICGPRKQFWAGSPAPFPGRASDPWAAGPGDRQVEMPNGKAHTPQLGAGPALPVTRDMGSGKLEPPGDLDRRKPARGAPNPPMGDSTTHSPALGGERPWGSAYIHFQVLRAEAGQRRRRGGLPAGGEMFHWFCCAGLTPEPKIEAELN